MAALRKIEKEREEEERFRHYANVPEKDYLELAGRQAKVVLEQGDRYTNSRKEAHTVPFFPLRLADGLFRKDNLKPLASPAAHTPD